MTVRRLSLALASGGLLLAGCGSAAVPPTAGPADAPTAQPSTPATAPAPAVPTAAPADRLAVTAAFYPLQWITSRVGGERVDVRTLAKPGAEPHDLELGPGDVRALGDADLVVYLRGFQPAVDEAVEQSAAAAALDAAPPAGLDLRYEPPDHGEGEHGEGEHGEGEHGGEEGRTDPHFWLDPTRTAAVGDAVADRLSGLDPAGAAAFRANAGALRSDLAALDGEFRAGTSSCASRDLVTSHVAFGYLARRYGFRQTGLAGLSPQDEPSPRDLAEVATYVRDNDVRTIYYETLVSPDIARTVADETGARTAVLDPIEGISDTSRGSDYLQVMRSNLASLRQGQSCS